MTDAEVQAYRLPPIYARIAERHTIKQQQEPGNIEQTQYDLNGVKRIMIEIHEIHLMELENREKATKQELNG